MNYYERFKLLSIFHDIAAGITAFFGCLPFFQIAFGMMMFNGMMGNAGPNAPPREVMLLFFGMAVMMSVLMWTCAAAMAAAGHFLRVQRYYTFCLVVAAIECINMPFGTVLGIFTIITLVDEKGKAMFDRPHSTPLKDESI